MPRSLSKPIEYEAKSDIETKPLRLKRNGTVPLGFIIDPENSKFVISVPEKIVALKQLYKMVKNINYSYKQLQEWYKAATGDKICIAELGRMRNDERKYIAIQL